MKHNNTIQMVNDKLNEYGFTVFNHHEAEDDQYVFYCEDMIVCIIEEHELAVSFQATTRPDSAAINTLILKEIPGLDVNIMESFIYTDKNEVVAGDKAFDLINSSIKSQAVNEYKEQQTYKYLLDNVKCFDC